MLHGNAREVERFDAPQIDRGHAHAVRVSAFAVRMDAAPRAEAVLDDMLEVRDACLCLHAQRAARAIARRFDLALKPIGLTSGQFSLLMSLNRPQPPQLGSVAALLAMDRTTLTANLKPLERAGLVATQTGPDEGPGKGLPSCLLG